MNSINEDVQITVFTGACGVGKSRRLLEIRIDASARILRNADLKAWLIDDIKPTIDADTIVINNLGDGLHYTMMVDLWIKLFELVDDGATLYVATHRNSVLHGLSTNLPGLDRPSIYKVKFDSKPKVKVQVCRINGQGKEDDIYSDLDLKVCMKENIEMR